jgi:putative copper resistance protein D
VVGSTTPELTATLARAASDGAAVATLGLAVVPMLDIERYRSELIRRATALLAVAGGVWLMAELARLIVAAAQAAALPVTRIGVRTSVEFALATAPGRAGLVSVVAAAAVCVAVVALPRTASTNVAIAGVAAVGVAARALTGHFAEGLLGGLAIAVHTLAAAVWCGALVALVMTVHHRGQWARVLPRFSQLALVCVAALLAGGVVGAVVRLDSPLQLYSTGYGQLLTTKIAVTTVLIALAWRNRTMWLPAARSHRTTAVVSRSRALTELAIMAVALTLAAALAVAG